MIVENAQVGSKSVNKDYEKFVRGSGQPKALSKSGIISEVQNFRSEINLIKKQLIMNQAIHPDGDNRGVLELKLAEMESKLTSYTAT